MLTQWPAEWWCFSTQSGPHEETVGRQHAGIKIDAWSVCIKRVRDLFLNSQGGLVQCRGTSLANTRYVPLYHRQRACHLHLSVKFCIFFVLHVEPVWVVMLHTHTSPIFWGEPDSEGTTRLIFPSTFWVCFLLLEYSRKCKFCLILSTADPFRREFPFHCFSSYIQIRAGLCTVSSYLGKLGR